MSNDVLMNKDLGTFANGSAYEIDKWLLRKMLRFIGNPSISMVLWSGDHVSPANKKPVARTIIRDRTTLLKLLANPDLHFGDAYAEGRLEVEGNLVEFLETIYRSLPEASWNDSVKTRLSRLLNRPRTNSLLGSKDNIHQHYDIGNDFYKLWLDENMQYTCAYFRNRDMTLEEAQLAKLHHVCRKLGLRSGETVAEAGCGWGTLALHMAKHYGVKVKAYNISKEQIAFARKNAGREGLSDRVEYIEDDYRNMSGKFDAFVSVGMLEHVGAKNYRELGRVVNQTLKENGRGLIHSIGRNKPEPMNSWIEKRIFPGAYPPTLREMMEIFEPWGFSIIDVENLRLHYAKTLIKWLDRFENSVDKVSEMFNQQFVRMWRLYLAGSIAAFTTGYLQLFQVVFSHPSKNDVPWTRWHLYSE